MMGMKKYLVPILFTVVIIGLLGLAVKASVSNSNDAKTETSPSASASLTDEQKNQLKEGQSTGPKDAKVVVSEFADFQCPACKQYEPTLEELRKTYANQVLFVFKHFPLYPQPHKNAMVASIASESAGNQGKFWEYHDILYEKQDEWAELNDPKAKFAEYAGTVGLDVERFKKDLDAEYGKDAINRDKDFGTSLQINGTPTIYINGVKFNPQADGGLEGLQAKVKAAVEQANSGQ